MKTILLWIVLFISAVFPIQAAAQENPAVQLETQKNIPAPISVERKNINGTEYLIKVYDIADGTEPEQLIENDFELDGFLFSHETTDKKVNENTDTKEATEEVSVESQSKNLEDIVKLFPVTKKYNQDGYKGSLALDTGSIVTEAAGYATKNYTVSTTKEYPGLMYADPSFVSQTAVKDGYTLPLTDVSWTVMGTSLAGDSLVPTEYKAVATYAKTFSSQVPTGYVSKARYTGTVAKTQTGSITYTLTYTGIPLKTGMPLPLKIITAVIGILLLAGLLILLWLFLKSRKGAEIYNLIDKEYICIGHQAVTPKEPVIDLNEFDDLIQSNVFRFILDKQTTKALFGRNIAVTFKDVTIKHRVNERVKEYTFDLDMGGVLDAE